VSRRLPLALGAVLALAALVRFATLDVQSFWLDEAVTVGLVRLDFGEMLERIPDSESTPPLYYVLAWLWSRVFGDGEVGLRSLSALAGTLTVPVIYAIGARLLSQRAGLLASLLAAVNPLLVWYSQEARAYALLALLCALSTLLFLRARERPSAGRLAAWAAVSALALATHYFAGVLVVTEAVWLLAGLQARGRLRAALASGALVAVAAALLPIALDQRSHGGAAWIDETALGTRVAQVAKQFLVGYDAPVEGLLTALAAALAVAAVAASALLGDFRERAAAVVAGVLTATTLGLPLLLSLLGADYLIARNVIAGLVPGLVLVGIGFAVRRAGGWGLAGAGALAAIFAIAVIAVDVEPRYQRDDWRSAAEELAAVPGRQAVVAPASGQIPLALYLSAARPLPGNGAPVREIDVLGVAVRRPGEAPVPPQPPAAPTAPAPGFALAGVRRSDTYTLLRFRAPTPQPVNPAQLAATSLDGGPTAALVTP
jgi:mannosyltransferase